MQVTLVYILDVGLQLTDANIAKADNISFDQGTLTMLGLALLTNTAVSENGKIKVTILLETRPTGDSIWLTPEQLQYATRNLFRDVYALRMPAFVTAEEPVVTGAPPVPAPAPAPVC